MSVRYFIVGLSLVAGIFSGSCQAKTSDAGHGAQDQKTVPTASLDKPADVPKSNPGKTILFFMNPNGRPCQMQDEILTGMKKELTGLADVVYIKTTESDDREKFYAHGIRGLPSLIVVDKKGDEINRFPPGIQSKETILDALHRLDAE